MSTTTIGAAATQTGVSVETIRFYERMGLIARPPKREKGYRLYSADTIARIHFIRSLKVLGFKLGEIGPLLKILENDQIDCAMAEDMATKKIAEIDEKIQALETIKGALHEYKDQCRAKKPDGMCIINDLYPSDKTSEARA